MARGSRNTDGGETGRRRLLKYVVVFPVATVAGPLGLAFVAPVVGLGGAVLVTLPAIGIVLFFGQDLRSESAAVGAYYSGVPGDAEGFENGQTEATGVLIAYLWGLSGFGAATCLLITALFF